MKDVVKKSFLLGLGAASITKARAEKIVKELVKNNEVTIKQGKEMLKRVKKHADNERKKMQTIAGKEAKKIAGKLSVASKSQLGRVKKKLKSIDRELSSKGKKALQKILRELSR